ncbi:unnamed protein product [Heligmosomoides polygyrus]|uniref:HTH_48 domain-containing protein n=1 Tax=Heligmosomoides polygyrus TaxID=6339 RepID=A0A3P7YGQ6_HELPZ|nr:unnamed protein product [Heligmosomoides polygyrus]
MEGLVCLGGKSEPGTCPSLFAPNSFFGDFSMRKTASTSAFGNFFETAQMLLPSFTTKACVIASLVFTLERNSMYVTAPHDLVYLCVVGFFVYFKLSALLLEVNDPFAPVENLFCAVFMGGIPAILYPPFIGICLDGIRLGAQELSLAADALKAHPTTYWNMLGDTDDERAAALAERNWRGGAGGTIDIALDCMTNESLTSLARNYGPVRPYAAHQYRSMLPNLEDLWVSGDEKYVFHLSPAKQPVWVRPVDPLPTFVRRDVHGEKHLQSFWVCAHGPVYWKLFTKSTTMDSKAMVNKIEEMDLRLELIRSQHFVKVLLFDNAAPHREQVTMDKLA